MLLSIFTLAAAISGASLSAADTFEVAADVADVAASEPPLFAGDDGRERTARLLLVWAWRESRWQTGAVGDNGRSLGVLQINRMWLSDDALLSDRRLALRLGLRLMRRLSAECGSVRAGLYAYAAGVCSGTPRARDLVAHRCALAGGC